MRVRGGVGYESSSRLGTVAPRYLPPRTWKELLCGAPSTSVGGVKTQRHLLLPRSSSRRGQQAAPDAAGLQMQPPTLRLRADTFQQAVAGILSDHDRNRKKKPDLGLLAAVVRKASVRSTLRTRNLALHPAVRCADDWMSARSPMRPAAGSV